MAGQDSIDAVEAITVIKVANLEKSREWYSRLFGKGPDLEPFPGNVEFKVGGAWVQISEGKVYPSSWSFQIEVRNIVRERKRLTEVGIPTGEIGTVPQVISWFDIEDPDGNAMKWFQVLTNDDKITGGRG